MWKSYHSLKTRQALPNVNDCLGRVVSDCGQNLWAEMENPWIIMLIRGTEVGEVIRDGLQDLLWLFFLIKGLCSFSNARCKQILQ